MESDQVDMRWFISLLVLLPPLLALSTSRAEGPRMHNGVPLVTSLKVDAERARRERVPILLVFSAHECPYCRLLEEEFLRPMMISGEYDDRVLIRKLMLDDPGQIRGFEGRRVDPTEIASIYDISVTPTMLLLDHRGREVVKRLVGVGTIDFYGGTIDNAIDRALRKLRRGSASAPSVVHAPVQYGDG